MKRGTTPILPVRIKISNSDIQSIEFLFKQEKSERAPETLKKVYPGDSIEFDEEHNIYNISFTEEDTRLFLEDEPFYMDTRITIKGGNIPETPIITLRMHPTLFEDENEEEETPCGC